MFQFQLNRFNLLWDLLRPPLSGVTRAGQQVLFLLLHQASTASQEAAVTEDGGEVQ